jgi:hypothetical protein
MVYTDKILFWEATESPRLSSADHYATTLAFSQLFRWSIYLSLYFLESLSGLRKYESWWEKGGMRKEEERREERDRMATGTRRVRVSLRANIIKKVGRLLREDAFSVVGQNIVFIIVIKLEQSQVDTP